MVARDGSVMFRDSRIGRVRPVKGRWVWTSNGVDSPAVYPSRKAAVAALVRHAVRAEAVAS